MKKEIDDLGHTGPYRPPPRLRKRTEFSYKGSGDDGKVFEANEYVSAFSFALILRGPLFQKSLKPLEIPLMAYFFVILLKW